MEPLSQPADLPAALRARWEQAEERLCALVMGAPELYEAGLLAARRIADALGIHADMDALLAAYPEGAALAAASAPDLPLPPQSLADVAWLLRARELAAEAREADWRRLIAAARAAGRGWVTLGDQALPAAPLLHPFERLAVLVADGLAVREFVELDPDTYAPVYGAEVVDLQGRQPPAHRRHFDDQPAWEAGCAALRAELAGTVPQTTPQERRGAGGHDRLATPTR